MKMDHGNGKCLAERGTLSIDGKSGNRMRPGRGFGITMAGCMNLQQQLDSGLSHHQAGRLAEAERIYRQVLAQQPNHADALHLLGVLAVQAGRLDAAVELIRRAIRLKPDLAGAHVNLGNVLKEHGETRRGHRVLSAGHSAQTRFCRSAQQSRQRIEGKGATC